MLHHGRGHRSARPAGTGEIVVRTAALMAALIALLGIGGWIFGGSTGLVVMVAIGLVMDGVSYWYSDRIALRATTRAGLARAGPPPLRDRRAARRPRDLPMPPLYLIPSDSPNAFATGRDRAHAAVAVTRGLLAIMNDRELTGVLGHELSHVRNRDILVATVAAGIAGVISTVGYVLQWGLMLGGTGSRIATAARRSPRSRGSWSRRSSRCCCSSRSAARASTARTRPAPGSPATPTASPRARAHRGGAGGVPTRTPDRRPPTCSSSTRCAAAACSPCSRRTRRPTTDRTAARHAVIPSWTRLPEARRVGMVS